MTHQIALIGFGGVGQGVVRLLKEKYEYVSTQYKCHFKVVSICDLYKGSLHCDDGLDLDSIIASIDRDRTLDHYQDHSGLIRGLTAKETIERTNAKTIIEMTYTNVETGQPAIDHCKTAFTNKRNVILTNKGPVAIAKQELEREARKHGVRFFYEGAVMSGTPAIRMPKMTLCGNEFLKVQGILNGTTNYMLTQMEQGLDYDEALGKAQQLGYAEADPTNDVKGFDVLYKVLILSQELFGVVLRKEQVSCVGIEKITPDLIEEATREGKRWKLLGSIEKTDDGVQAFVKPVKVPLSDPLASVNGATNAITYDCDISGAITLIGAGAGIKETAFAVLIDLIHLEGWRST
ncbi:homoserine dehydrogenase [Bacillus sp. FJAT-45037]|uniref:homoserine dehydrogenase n=1 Tax=Bacillus sp. FJAT-45037 TaxID=2011007 RepID=UPI000C23F460|nr:homoserine dehydrogenase [Bacillus sp. FJAT-45037]